MNAMRIILAVLFLQSFIDRSVSVRDFIQKRAVDVDPCIITVDNTIINLNDLKTPNGYEVHYDGRQFLLNICATTPGCKGNVSVCEIDPRTKDVKHILGYFETRIILTSYKPIPGLKYQTSGRKKYRVEIEFKCNRRTNTNIVKYVPPQGEVGRRFKFIFESNSLCIQRKINCLVHNVYENSMFDLNPLNKKTDNWSIRNVPDGKQIFMNLCGPLNKIANVKDRECSYPGTQICLVDKGGVSKNLGIYTSDFYIHHNLSIIFSDGSICDGGNFTQTKVDFFCSFQAQPPVLVSSSSCNYRLTWHTPIACPHYVSFGTSCQIYDYFLGHRDFKPLFTNEDKKRRIGNKDVRYNVCDELFEPCGLFNNASICVNINDKPTVFGWTNATIVSKNTALTMDLSGEKCTTNVHRSTHINFVCDSAQNRPEKLTFSKDMCRLNIDIYTKTACFEHESNVANCTIQDGDHLYNLASLAADKNYEIQDPHHTNLVYVLNICRPIVFGTNAMCDRYSAVCLRNKTEPDITKRYKSLGNLVSLKRYTQNGGLFFKYDHGSICKLRNVSQSSTSTEIQFICTRNSQQQGLVFKEKDGCHFKFICRTHLVC